MHKVTRHIAEAFPECGLARSRKRSVRPSVETVHERDNLLPVSFTLPVEVLTRHLDAAFVRFGARIAEEHLVEPGHFAQGFCKFNLRVVREKVADMVKVIELVDYRLLDARILVTESVHGDTRHKIKELIALGIEQVRAFALHEFHIGLTVKRRNVFLVLLEEIIQELCHSSILH